MRDHEGQVADHYTTGALTERVRSALREVGVDPDHATAEDLKAGDEFHTGGVAASDHFFGHLADQTVGQACWTWAVASVGPPA